MIDLLSFEQILGYVAGLILLIGYAIKDDKRTKAVLIISSLLFSFHFFMLGAFTACAITIINALRNASSIFWHKSYKIFLVFALLYILSTYFTYNSPIDILPFLASFITCVGMFLLSGLYFRIIVVVAVLMWIVHNIVVGSIGGTIESIILLFVSLVTVYRLYKDKNHDQQNT